MSALLINFLALLIVIGIVALFLGLGCLALAAIGDYEKKENLNG